MQPIVRQYVLINNNRIAFGVHGPADGRPVVLIHGTPSSSLIFRNIIPHLVTAGYRCHFFDLLGYGLSERPWDSSIDTSISGQVPILLALLSHWGLNDTKVHVIAHDIGGGIAQRFCIFHAERVRSLTMIDVVSFDSYPSARTKQQMKTGLDVLAKAPLEQHREAFREWLLSAVHDREKFKSSGALETYLDYISGPIGQASFFEHQVRHYDAKHTMEIAERYHELGKVPVKLIWGRNDAWQVIDWAKKLKDAIPGSDLSIVDDAGHFSLEDQPEQISKLIRSFLKLRKDA